MFSLFDSKSFIYCVLAQGDDETKDFTFWTQPFKSEVWITLALIMAGYCLYSQAGIRDNKSFPLGACVRAFKYVEVMTGNGEIHNSKFQLCFAFLGVFVCFFYSSCLLGFAVREPPPAHYTSIKEILSNGYKILHLTRAQQNIKNNIVRELKLRGILVSEVFHASDELNPTHEFFANSLTEKNIDVPDRSVAQRWVQMYKHILNAKARFKYECSVLPESLRSVPFFEPCIR